MWIFGLGATLMAVSSCALILLHVYSDKQTHSVKRIIGAAQPVWLRQSRVTRFSLLESLLADVANLLRKHVGLKEDAKAEERFQLAGLRTKHQRDLFFVARVAVPVTGLVAGSLIRSHALVSMVALIGFGYLLPGLWLEMATRKRSSRLRRGVSDAVDLLAICVDAGLGLDQALLRVSQELKISHPELSDELLQVNREQRAGRPRIEAWRNLSERSKLKELEEFVGMLAQAERFGTPLVVALNTFSTMLRTQRRQRAEQAAAKTTVKIIFPLVLFIFPVLFIVLLAPAVFAMFGAFSQVMK